MTLIDQLKEMRDAAVATRNELWAEAQKLGDISTNWHNRVDELDVAILAIQKLRGLGLDPAPELEAPAQELPSPELLSVTPATEEESGDQIELDERAEPVSVLDDPELQAAVDRAEQTLAMVDEQTCEPVDARVSWADEMSLTEPETVQPDAGGYAPVTEPEPERKAGVLEDPELDAEYEEMKRRETAHRKLHFSIFGHKFEDA